MIPAFEYDPAKSEANLAKHGIDFEAAQNLWRDENRVLIAARSIGEERFALIGILDGKYWTAFATQRERMIRIISVRRSRRSEVREYEDRDQAEGDQR
jgi:uncharacterized DUF497 family protein